MPVFRFLGAALATTVAASPVRSGAVAPPSLTPQDQAMVAQATTYLESLATVEGHFTQTDARGRTAGGIFYLQRPGKARLDYDPPSGVTVASDGRVMIWVDRRLKTIQRAPLGFTPFALFLARNIRLDKGVTVSNVTRTAEGFSLTARKGQKNTQGQITLSFSVAPLALKGWALTEPQGGTTTVILSRLTPAAPHAMAFFQPRPPPAPTAAVEP